MPSENKFQSGLNNWGPEDRPKREDFVRDNTIIDEFMGITVPVNLEKKLDVAKIANNLTTQDEGYVLDARQGTELARKTIRETLWSGTLSIGGSVTVPNLNSWRLIYVRTSAPSTTILIAMHGVPLRGCSGFGESNQIVISVELAVAGDVVTLTSCKNLTHNSTTGHNTGSDGNIIGIYGLIRQ